MGRYKKKLRAEKAKVKLKKKKLPKGQNVTDTSFKVKKIVTVEQLKKVGESEPVSSWNVPLKDLLINLGHHNKSSRLNALNGIKEIIIKFPGAVKGTMLKNTVMKILELISDVETKIRATAINVLDVLFGVLNDQEILGFNEILNLHLTCAMTHRHPAVQKDSLKLADVIIKYAPAAIKQNIKVVMVNFIRILSSYKYGAKSEIFLVKGSKKDLEENRIAIFQRLRSVLKICYLEEKENEDDEIPCNGIYFSRKLLIAYYKKHPTSSGILKNHGSVIKKTSPQDYEKDFKLVVSQIMPLIFETWSEFCPKHSKDPFIKECVLKETTARLLSLILETIVTLYESSLKFETEDLKNLFEVNYGNQIMKSFFFGFPYLPQVTEEKSYVKNESVASFNRSFESQNLTLCYLAYSMKLKISNNLKKILDNYVIQASQVRNTKSEEILSKIFEFVILSPRRQKRIDSFLKMAFKCYKISTNPRFQNRLLEILSKVIEDDIKYTRLKENSHLHEWISYLAKGLCKSKMKYEALETLSKAIQRKIDTKILSDIENQFMVIMKNIPKIEIEGCNILDGQKCIANILFWCDNEIIEGVLNNGLLEDTKYPNDIKSYMINIFTFKLREKIL